MTAKWTADMLRGAVAELRRSRTAVDALPAIERLVGFKVSGPSLHAALTARNLGKPSDYVGADYDDGLDDLRAMRRPDVTSTPLRNGQRNVKPEVTAPVDAAAPTDRPPAACPGRLDAMGEPFGTCVLPAGHDGAHDWREIGQAPPFEPMPWHDVAPKRDELPSLTGVRCRVIVPDSHGHMIDHAAAAVFLRDLAHIRPEEIVMLGDHVDVSGLFSRHAPTTIQDAGYSYESDCDSANWFLDEIQKAAPNARVWQLEGNHEQRAERWCAQTIRHQRDAGAMRDAIAPDTRLRLKQRGFTFVRMTEFWHGQSVPGMIKLGACRFVHGMTTARHAAAGHRGKTNACIVNGHVHRVQSDGGRNVDNGEIAAWCPGTLSLLQPLWLHTNPSDWRHGYALQMVEPDGSFFHYQCDIVRGKSGLAALSERFRTMAPHGRDES